MEKISHNMPAEEEYYELFPVTLFECFDQISPMHFILSLKQNSGTSEDIVKVMRHCGAKVAFNKEDANMYSALIADHNDVIDFYGPTFTTNYISECLALGKLQDIGKYRQEATKHLKFEHNAVCMEVVYYRKFGWDSVVTEEDKRWIDDNCKVQLSRDGNINSSSTVRNRDQTVTKINKSNNNSVKEKESGRIERKDKEKMKGRTNEIEDNVSNEKEDTTSKTDTRDNNDRFFDLDDNEKNECVSMKSQTSRQAYTKEERCKILKYIVDHNEYARLKGKELWVIMETKKVCTSRTWQSMKEHFMKKIIYDLDGFDFITNEQKRKIQRVCF